MTPIAPGQEAAAAFNPLRQSLARIAYRMLGSVADAEDVVQDAFLRWLDVDRDAVRNPAAFLRQIVTRLAMDRLRALQRSRTDYVGQWLPEPTLASAPEDDTDVTLPLLIALERLSPLERAAFLLHDVFCIGFDEVAAAIGRDPVACRQLASRARDHVRADRPRYPVQPARGLEIAEAFYSASRDGDTDRLRTLLAADVMLFADGGGKVPARREPAIGVREVIRLFAAFAKVYASHRSRLLRIGFVSGLPGFVTVERGVTVQATALEISGGMVAAIYIVRNPEKLGHLADIVAQPGRDPGGKSSTATYRSN